MDHHPLSDSSVAPCTSSAARSPGFTLIEMIVVLSIIALLAAILLPVLANARRHAQRAVCLSNLHQIGVAQHAYAASHDDYFIHYSQLAPDAVWRDPSSTPLPLIDARPKLLEFGQTAEIYYCPERKDRQPRDSQTFWLHHTQPSELITYFILAGFQCPPGSNNAYRRPNDADGVDSSRPEYPFPRKVTATDPDEPLAMDITQSFPNSPLADPGTWSRPGSAATNHADFSTNVVYADGSAKRTAGDTVTRNMDGDWNGGGITWDRAVFW